jgi:hypothetical protein
VCWNKAATLAHLAAANRDSEIRSAGATDALLNIPYLTMTDFFNEYTSMIRLPVHSIFFLSRTGK